MERTGKRQGRLNLMGRDSSALALRSFLAFLQGVFKDGYFGFKWQADRNLTDIVIQEGPLDGVIDPDSVTKMPAVFVHEGPAQWQNMNAATLSYLNLGTSRREVKSPETFSLICTILSDDADEMKDVTATIFTMIPTFPSLLGKSTGIAFPGSPSKQYQLIQGKSGSAYPAGIIVMPASVMVGLDISHADGSLFDTLLESVTMTIRAASPDPPTPRTRTPILANEPKDMIDVILFERPVDPLEGVSPADGVIEQETELEEDS